MRFVARLAFIRRTGWKLGCLTSLSVQIFTTHHDVVVASFRSQGSPRCNGAGVTPLTDPECLAASRGYWRPDGVFEQFGGVSPHRCRTGYLGPHTPQGGGRLNASASRCYPQRHELSSYPSESFFSQTEHRRPPSADNVATSARLDPSGQPRRTGGRCLKGP